MDAADRRRERHPRRLPDARRPRGSGAGGAALRRHRVRDLRLVRQRRATGSRCSRTCRRRRSPTSGSTATTSCCRRWGAAFWIMDNMTPLQQLALRHQMSDDRRRTCSSRATRTGCATRRSRGGPGRTRVPAAGRVDRLLPGRRTRERANHSTSPTARARRCGRFPSAHRRGGRGRRAAEAAGRRRCPRALAQPRALGPSA